MEERKYTFYDRYQKVKYANITAEELEVLNISYNKEHYMFDQQHQRNNTVLFCGLESENSCATDFIADDGRDIASDITTEIFFKELFSDLTEKEKKIVSDYFIMGKQVKETAAEALLAVGPEAAVKKIEDAVASNMQDWGKRYPHAGYGGCFRHWLKENNPKPYGSYGNGSAMRVSAVGWLYDSMERTREVARATANVTHNHPEGIKGAESTATGHQHTSGE